MDEMNTIELCPILGFELAQTAYMLLTTSLLLFVLFAWHLPERANAF